jgi:hypothetical protein
LLILVHDLDSANSADLRKALRIALDPCPIETHIIVIPEKEIEAWLLADHEAIGKVMSISLGRVPNPEAIMKPKERLRDLVYTRSRHKIRYINSIHNKEIAEACSLANLRRCKSFRPLEEFLRTHLN